MKYEPHGTQHTPVTYYDYVSSEAIAAYEKMLEDSTLVALAANRGTTARVLDNMGVPDMDHSTYPAILRKLVAACIGITAARSIKQLVSPAGFDRPSVLCVDEEKHKFEVKPRQTYMQSRMVEVVQSASLWGDVVVTSSFIGKILSSTDTMLQVEVVYASRDGSFVVKTLTHNNVGRIVTVSKRSAEILDPWMLPVGWYVSANRALLCSRHLELRRKLNERFVHSPLNPINDGRQMYRYWNNNLTNARSNLRNRAILKFQGKLQAYLMAKMSAGILVGLEITRSIKKHFAGTTTRFDIDEISGSSMIRAAISRYNAKLIAADQHDNENYDEDEPQDADVSESTSDRMLSIVSCSHVERNDRRIILDTYGSRDYHCAKCAETRINAGDYIQLLDAEGAQVWCYRDNTRYSWADGTVRCVSEPSIIGAYHSSKRYIGLLSPIVGEAPSSGLTLGIELEMEKAGGNVQSDEERNGLAHLVRARMLKAHEAGGVPVNRKNRQYGFFERDGSVEQGFEMVTGWGNLATHRHFIRHIFGAVNGEEKLPFVGKLVSHDANSSCGLHVHMAKPKSLVHAAKLQAFYQDKSNARLVRAVARRMDVRYAKVAEGKGKDNLRGNLRKAIRDTGCSVSGCDNNKERKMVQNRAITALSNNERYQMVNFCNEKTVEIRVFKGSMLPVTILACIEFAHASWFFSRDIPADRLTSDEFLSWIATPEHRHETANLRAYLAVRGFKTYVPNKHHSVPEDLHEFNADGA